MKHNFGIENEKKGRGRPKKEFLEEEYMNQTRKDYNNFLEEKKKKKEENVDLSDIKGVFNDMFIRYRNDLFEEVENILEQCMMGAADLAVDLVCDIHTGKTWYELK